MLFDYSKILFIEINVFFPENTLHKFQFFGCFAQNLESVAKLKSPEIHALKAL